MRPIGAVMILVGALIAYLGWNSKLGNVWSALMTGQVPQPKQPTQAQKNAKAIGSNLTHGAGGTIPNGPTNLLPGGLNPTGY